MDAAFADRWCRHKMGYPPADVERGILRQRHGQANELDLAAVVAVANSLRQRFVAGDIPKTCSMRATLNAARRLSLGSSLKRALVSAIVNQYEGDMSDPSSDAGRVWSYIRGTVPADRLQ